jgi:hypothetical protein
MLAKFEIPSVSLFLFCSKFTVVICTVPSQDLLVEFVHFSNIIVIGFFINTESWFIRHDEAPCRPARQ